jgi:hypothetical protein
MCVLALEAAFASGLPQAGQRITFARLRIRGFNLPAGTYRITHPYGSDTFVVDELAPRNINFTDDVLPVPEVFTGALGGRIGPLLRWDSGAPAGFLGDPATPHRVTGSPFGTNHLAVERQTASGFPARGVHRSLHRRRQAQHVPGGAERGAWPVRDPAVGFAGRHGARRHDPLHHRR